MTEFLKYTEEDYKKDLSKVSDQIFDREEHYDIIVGLRFGADRFALELGERHDTPVFLIKPKDCPDYIPDFISNGMDLLLVDEIIDTGQTLSQILEDLEDYSRDDWDWKQHMNTACLIYNESQTLVKPTFFGRTINREVEKRHFVFPWEPEFERI